MLACLNLCFDKERESIGKPIIVSSAVIKARRYNFFQIFSSGLGWELQFPVVAATMCGRNFLFRPVSCAKGKRFPRNEGATRVSAAPIKLLTSF